MSEKPWGSNLGEVSDLRSSDPSIRARAALRIWQLFVPRLLDLVRLRLNPRIQGRADENDPVWSRLGRFANASSGTSLQPGPTSDALLRLLVSVAMCEVVDTAHKHPFWRQAEQRDVHPTTAPRSSYTPLANLMRAFEGRSGLLQEESVVIRDEFERLFGSLSEPLQQIFVWKLEDYSNARISRLINRTERTVELKLHIIRKTLEQDPRG